MHDYWSGHFIFSIYRKSAKWIYKDHECIWPGAMLYYILHFYLIHIICVVVFFAQGFGVKDIVPTGGLPFYFKPNGLGFGLLGVYAIWLLVVVLLYPVCKKYDQYKTAHAKEKWWVSYI